MLRFKNVSKSYGETAENVLEGFDLTIQKGDFLAILGPNGAGKSTLLKLAYGLLIPDEGTIEFESQSMQIAYDALLPGHPEMEWVDQKMETLPYHTVEENVRQKMRRWEFAEREQRLEFIRDFFELKDCWSMKAAKLSGGFQQRLALARAICVEPKFLLLDEPFSQLDPAAKRTSFAFLKKINQEMKTTILMVTHQVEEALFHAKEGAFLCAGKLIQKEAARSFYLHPKNRALAQFCGEISFLDQKDGKALFPTLELPTMEDGTIAIRPNVFSLYERARANSIKAKVIGKEERAHYNLYNVELSNRFSLLVSSAFNLDLEAIVYLSYKL